MQSNDTKYYYYITIVFRIYEIKNLEILLESIKTFSSNKLIVYLISIDSNDTRLIYLKKDKRVILKHINKLLLPSSYKPYVIIDAIEKNQIFCGLFINVNSIITKYCDDIFSLVEDIEKFPLSAYRFIIKCNKTLYYVVTR